jgi:hypothetical protein
LNVAYYGSTPINQGAAGLGIVPRAQQSARSKDILSIVAPPFAMMGLGQDEVVEETLVVPTMPSESEVAPSEVSPPAPVVVATPEPSPWAKVGRVLSIAGAVGGAYHGYKRNQSAGWAFGWLVFGSVMPIFAIPLALAQGFGQPKRG